MIPLGPKLNTVFASRWKALLWAGGILLTAYCTVPSAEDTTAGDESSEAQAGLWLRLSVRLRLRTNRPPHQDPWAVDRK
jgi:hypothetical protein